MPPEDPTASDTDRDGEAARPSAWARLRRHRVAIATGLGLVVIAALSVWLRWPGFSQGRFASHDVAGMLYEAMVLHDGGLPYVDTIELKAPGTFYLAAALAGEGGRDIAVFQIWANAWAVATLLTVGAIAWRLWGPAAAIVAAGLYGLHDAHLDSMDANYVTWAQLPLVAGVGAALVAPRARHARIELGWWAAAGLLVGVATLLKRPAGVGVIVVIGIALWPLIGRRLADARGEASTDAASRPPPWMAAVAVLGGVLGSHLPIVIHYASAEQLPALFDGYLWSRWGMRYISYGGEPWGVGAVREGVLATAHFLALPLALSLAAIWPPRDAASRRQHAALGLWALATIAAAWVGLRFYKGYFLAPAAPLCLLAAAPWGLLGARSRVRGPRRAVLLLPALLLVLRQLAVLDHQREDRARPHDQGGRVIAKYVSRYAEPGDRIWVWGWHLWDVYPLTGMRSGSRIYKSLGLLTPPNDDTWRRPAKRLEFVDGEAAALLLEDLRRTRPAWIVLGSTVPRGQFEALRSLLHEEYAFDRKPRLGRVQFWQRRDLYAARERR